MTAFRLYPARWIPECVHPHSPCSYRYILFTTCILLKKLCLCVNVKCNVKPLAKCLKFTQWFSIVYINELNSALRIRNCTPDVTITATAVLVSSIQPARLLADYFAVHQFSAGFLWAPKFNYATEPRSGPSQNQLTSHMVFTALETE